MSQWNQKKHFMGGDFSFLGTITIIELASSLDCTIYDFINASSYSKWLRVPFINKSINHVCNSEILLRCLLKASHLPRSKKFTKSNRLGRLVFLKFVRITRWVSKFPSKSRFLWLDKHTHICIIHINDCHSSTLEIFEFFIITSYQ